MRQMKNNNKKKYYKMLLKNLINNDLNNFVLFHNFAKFLISQNKIIFFG